MNDKELADRVVALGIGSMHNTDKYSFFPWSPAPKGAEFFTAHDFVRDWRVAGALMEETEQAMFEVKTYRPLLILQHKIVGYRWHKDESLPRAIIEACCEALEGDK